MKAYTIQIYRDGIPMSLVGVKQEKQFFWALSKILHNRLPGIDFTSRVCNDGVIVESESIPDFVGSAIPFQYMNMNLVLLVDVHVWTL